MASWQCADQCDALNPPARPGPRGYPRDDFRDPGPAFEPRPYARRRLSGTVVALIVGGAVLAVGLLAGGGGFLYWMLNRHTWAIQSAASSPVVPPQVQGSMISYGLSELYYTDNVTATDASTLGAYLSKIGYLSGDRSAFVELDADEQGTFIVPLLR